MSARFWLGASALGFGAGALVHLGTFTPLAPLLGEAHAAVLFAAASLPLAAMVRRLRRLPVPARQWRRLRILDGRRVAALVPPPVRALMFAAGMYVLMNLVLSLTLIGGVSVVESGGAYYAMERGGDRQEISREAFDMHRAASLRGLSGPLLLLYLVPLVYFAFVEPRRAELSRVVLGPDASSPSGP